MTLLLSSLRDKDLESVLRLVLPVCGRVLAVPLDNRYPALDLSPQRQRELTMDAVVSLLVELGERQPVAWWGRCLNEQKVITNYKRTRLNNQFRPFVKLKFQKKI